MSPWTALLESLHSATIDEINERLPGHKPELGMPIRQRELTLPSTDLRSALICEVTFQLAGGTEARGFALLGSDAEGSARLKLDPRGLWDALIKRAGGEFLFHGIKPRFGTISEIKGTLPEGFAVPTRVIWVPFRLHPGNCYLGMGA